MVVTLLLGGGAGLWATLLSCICAAYVLLDSTAFGILSPIEWAASAIYAATTAGLVGLVVALRKAFLAADAAQDELRRAATSAAEREAFLIGSTLIERSLRSYFGGTAETEFPPDGLRFTLDAPLGDAAFQSGTA